ncbi:MAG: isoprenylcysteine carboxyl methyltransferase family protein [Candidatus Doudnabacteria bacterium]|nr:isoprenylcysteine carboxyl methyltransferase family protein [Candidatus Doudnabacteria bacterium]
MPSIYTQIAYLSWNAILLVWLPGYFTGKRTIQRPNPIRRAFAFALIIAGFMFLFSNSGPGNSFAERFLAVPHLFITPSTVPFGIIGLIIDLTAIVFAIWARIALGRNWSNAIALKENHELVQTGPYAIVRHPIYTGLVFAAFGTALTIGRLTDYIGVILLLVAILIRIQDEDALMAEQFSESHPAYRQRTKKLVPFVW